jgi:hypothetical protein
MGQSRRLDDVRFTPGSDRTADIPDRQLRAMKKLMHSTKMYHYSKTSSAWTDTLEIKSQENNRT